jgi:hypothetical protein
MKRPFENLDSGLPIVFDGLKAQAWFVFLHNPVQQARVQNISAGVLYTVAIEQDEVGSYEFVWPDACKNAMFVSPEPGAITTQNFIGLQDGTLIANLPGTWTTKETSDDEPE